MIDDDNDDDDDDDDDTCMRSRPVELMMLPVLKKVPTFDPMLDPNRSKNFI